jgi:hypothetical protein
VRVDQAVTLLGGSGKNCAEVFATFKELILLDVTVAQAVTLLCGSGPNCAEVFATFKELILLDVRVDQAVTLLGGSGPNCAEVFATFKKLILDKLPVLEAVASLIARGTYDMAKSLKKGQVPKTGLKRKRVTKASVVSAPVTSETRVSVSQVRPSFEELVDKLIKCPEVDVHLATGKTSRYKFELGHARTFLTASGPWGSTVVESACTLLRSGRARPEYIVTILSKSRRLSAVKTSLALYLLTRRNLSDSLVWSLLNRDVCSTEAQVQIVAKDYNFN